MGYRCDREFVEIGNRTMVSKKNDKSLNSGLGNIRERSENVCDQVN